MYKLGKGLEENNNIVRYINIGNDRFKYSDTNEYGISRKLEGLLTSYPAGSFRRFTLYPLVILSRLYILLNEIFKSDVFIFSGTQSFFDFYDLPILKLFGKTIIVMYFGSDARPTYLSGKHIDDHNTSFTPKRSYYESKKIKNRVHRVEKWSHYIVNHIGTSQFFTRKCVMFSYLGIPYDKSLLNLEKSNNEILTNRIRVLHAPSRPKAKGSAVFKRIISELKTNNKEIDYIEITNKTNNEVIKEIQACDIVLDELYSDMPLATLGVEASILKKPIIVGGYFSRYISKSTPKKAIPPVIFVEPKLIEGTIVDLINHRTNWKTIGQMQYLYVKENYSPSVVAKKIELLSIGKVPDEYWFSPIDEDYIHGWGLSEKQLKTQLREYIEELGVESLLLQHNLALKDKLVEFCYT